LSQTVPQSDSPATSPPPPPPQPPSPPPPPGSPAIMVASGTIFASSPVTIVFSISNFTIGSPGTPHLRFSIDGGAQHDFYNGTANPTNLGVRLNNVHTHFVHWKSSSSFDLFALAAGGHQIRLVLVDGSNSEIAGTATFHNFTVQASPPGQLQLELVLGGLNFPVGLAQASDGRIFYNERFTGAVRTISPGWTLNPDAFCNVPVVASGEQGLLGLALDPAFSPSNEVVYVFYTAPGPVNRISRLSRSAATCTETIILNNLPASATHNGGIILFGADGNLYVIIGDADIPSESQNLTSLRGKILRVTTSGAAASGNPFVGSGDVNQDKVYSYGHRNSFGLAFHPATNQLWESENGPADNDEVNGIVSAGNYGWPIVGGIQGNPNFINPILAFNPVVAPTGIIAIPAGSPVYPSFLHNNLLVADFIGGRIHRIVLGGAGLNQLSSSNVAFNGGLGGLLSFMRGSDAYIYVSNSNGIFRVISH
jgi:aldose sugar dehydrogenase